MRKIAANMIFTLTAEPLKNSYLVLDNDGTILEVVDTKGQLSEIASLEYYNGILIPGFIFEAGNNSLEYPLNYYWNKGIQAIVNTELEKPDCKPVLIKKALTNNILEFNWSTDILEQIKQLQLIDNKQSFEQIIRKFTVEKAKELKSENQLGSFKSGAKPGVLLIYPFDFKEYRLINASKLQRLI